ncbi:MAG TPA: class I tRNA ligase family protein [Candidatus Paceibacterota bacterium]|nr:class I tRNA ligase family protein [Candidatus Paceibacterota bacterium]
MLDFKKLEEDVLKFWEENHIFERSLKQREGNEPWVFFEGPPTANGSPGIHHFISRCFKDLFCRYQTMKGRYVLRKGGWDTHGLPVELQVERELGFTNKKDIEKFGVAAYNKKCRESVWKYKAEWERFTHRIGFWLDLKDAYVTYETPYMESLWNIIAHVNSQGLLYQAHRVVPFCTRCGTPLSNHEVAQGYRKVTENSVYLKFKVTKSSKKLGLPKNTSILAWTTTPWTLPGNVALAVGPDIRYALVAKGDEHFILAEELVEKVMGTPLKAERTFKGSELAGITYEPLFSVRALKKPKSYKVYGADFVTTTDGTGVVHTAVMYGEDDYRLGVEVGLPTTHTVTEQGTFTGVSRELDGLYVKDAKTEALILEHLKANDNLFAQVPYEHDYPFCWRCDTPLLYYAKDSWFIRMSEINKQMLANNDSINWVPSHLKNGRFGQWIAEAKDWAFSRERYWGTPLPIWRSKDKKQTLVAASLDDLEKYRATKGNTYWLVRHGEAEKNVRNIIDSGSGRSGLTGTGRDQALATAKELERKLSGKKPVIVSSPLPRAHETATIVAQYLGAKSATDRRLAEIQLGPSLDGCHDGDYHEMFPTYADKFTKRPPEGESLTDLRARVWEILKELEEKYDGKDIVLVSHEYPIWMIADAANGWSMAESVAEKEKRGNDFLPPAGIEKIIVRNLPRNEGGVVDMHRPYVDTVTLKIPGSRAVLTRIPELCDVWFDSGAMPFAQWHWPLDNTDVFATQFPADFISEGVDQTRGWFYTLLAVATLMGKGAPYRNIISLGHVLDEKGQKMSKSRGNIVKPDDVIDAVGADVVRWYFYTVNDPGDSKLFSMKDVRERMTGFMGTLANCLRFYELYEGADAHGERTELDRWVLSRLAGLIHDVSQRLDEYDPTAAARAIEAFVVEDFSQWWLRRSRRRADARWLLRYILRTVALLSAPFIPFAAEDLWQKIRQSSDPVSVHLADWPRTSHEDRNEKLEERMARVRADISAGLAIRKSQNIRVRQPLASVTIPGTGLDADLEALIRDELNVKSVRYAPGEVSLDLNITQPLKHEGWAREMMRVIQDLRKEAGFNVGQEALVRWHTADAEAGGAIETWSELIARDTNSKLERGAQGASGKASKEFALEPGRTLDVVVY